eukprot:GHVT01031714.1.p2 GENE.GHVT01031714.1~~GHVT01031714.1.p2  ORF type:complete len:123 (-),score=22.32 GHVT01031714.1:2410-2778(-)
MSPGGRMSNRGWSAHTKITRWGECLRTLGGPSSLCSLRTYRLHASLGVTVYAFRRCQRSHCGVDASSGHQFAALRLERQLLLLQFLVDVGSDGSGGRVLLLADVTDDGGAGDDSGSTRARKK